VSRDQCINKSCHLTCEWESRWDSTKGHSQKKNFPPDKFVYIWKTKSKSLSIYLITIFHLSWCKRYHFMAWIKYQGYDSIGNKIMTWDQCCLLLWTILSIGHKGVGIREGLEKTLIKYKKIRGKLTWALPLHVTLTTYLEFLETEALYNSIYCFLQCFGMSLIFLKAW